MLLQLGRHDISNLTLNCLDKSGITKDQYDNALEGMDEKVSMVYKRILNEGYISL